MVFLTIALCASAILVRKDDSLSAPTTNAAIEGPEDNPAGDAGLLEMTPSGRNCVPRYVTAWHYEPYVMDFSEASSKMYVCMSSDGFDTVSLLDPLGLVDTVSSLDPTGLVDRWIPQKVDRLGQCDSFAKKHEVAEKTFSRLGEVEQLGPLEPYPLAWHLASKLGSVASKLGSVASKLGSMVPKKMCYDVTSGGITYDTRCMWAVCVLTKPGADLSADQFVELASPEHGTGTWKRDLNPPFFVTVEGGFDGLAYASVEAELADWDSGHPSVQHPDSDSQTTTWNSQTKTWDSAPPRLFKTMQPLSKLGRLQRDTCNGPHLSFTKTLDGDVVKPGAEYELTCNVWASFSAPGGSPGGKEDWFSAPKKVSVKMPK